MSQEGHYEQLYHQAPCGYLLTDENWTITAANDTFLAWAGYRSDDVLGTALPQLMPMGDRLLHWTSSISQLQLTVTMSTQTGPGKSI